MAIGLAAVVSADLGAAADAAAIMHWQSPMRGRRIVSRTPQGAGIAVIAATLLIAGGAIVGFVPSGAPFPSVVFAATAANIIRQFSPKFNLQANQIQRFLVRVIWRLCDFVGPYIDNRVAIDILNTEYFALRWTADDGARQIVALRKKMMSFPR